jgi:NADP-dependent 3-hydroxy acid dehydrogenase YdfG
MTNSSLTGTVSLVTGASSGIGEATALALAAEGSTVALAARRADRLGELASRIESAGGTALVIEADVTQQSDAAGAVDTTVQRFGRLDVLVNNAGVMLLGPMSQAPLSEWERMIDLNLTGLLYCTHAALPHLLAAAESSERGVADLVNISSVAGRVARSGSAVYNATKHGVGALSEALRQEVTKQHLRVGLIEPGAVATELAGHNRPEVLETLGARFASMERLVAEDISDAVVFMVTRPRRTAVNEILIRPTEQEG